MRSNAVPLGLRMLGPALMVLGALGPWGGATGAQRLDGWSLVVLAVGIPALLLSWLAETDPRAIRGLAALAVIAAGAALGAWWMAGPEVEPAGKGPLWTLAGAVLTGATLPVALQGWQRVLAAGIGMGLVALIALSPALGRAWRGPDPGAAAGAGATPWIVVEVYPPGKTPTVPGMQRPIIATPTSPKPGALGGPETPTGEPREAPSTATPALPAPEPSPAPPWTPSPTPTPPPSPATPPSSPLSP